MYTKDNWICNPLCHRHFGDPVTKISNLVRSDNSAQLRTLIITWYTIEVYTLMSCKFDPKLTHTPLTLPLSVILKWQFLPKLLYLHERGKPLPPLLHDVICSLILMKHVSCIFSGVASLPQT